MTTLTPLPPSRALGTLRAVLTGRARPYTRPGSVSAIHKTPRQGPVAVSMAGLDGDEQGDLRVHGGPDKAVHCFSLAHYGWWRSELAGWPQAGALLAWPGAFGENFSLDGPDEWTVCLGDEWQVGGARLQVSQGRQPCWKLSDRFGVPDMARRVQSSLRAGWYLRVLEEGVVRAGDSVWLTARPHPDWPLARLLQAIDQRDCTPALIEPLLQLPLPPSWERLFRRRLETGRAEDWTARLEGPAP